MTTTHKAVLVTGANRGIGQAIAQTFAANGGAVVVADLREVARARARGVDVWAALRTLGRSGVADLIERTCSHARRFAAGLAAAGVTVPRGVTLFELCELLAYTFANEPPMAENRGEPNCGSGRSE
jgi:NAD(P)-dependent dehydrogenase (short-subunit alcohol dehydrogenase family)